MTTTYEAPMDTTMSSQKAVRLYARLKYWMAVVAFVGPFLLFLVVFQYIPVITMLRDSLQDYMMLNPTDRIFVGLNNYWAVLSNPEQRNTFIVTFLFAIGVVCVVVPCSFMIAVYLNGDLPARRLIRTVVFLPVITSSVVVATMWTFLLDPTSGLANNFLASLGFPKQGFLTDPTQALPSLVVVFAWQHIGFAAIIYLSALQAIPQELIEAARLDGATAFQRLRWITLPLLSRTTVFIVVIMSVFALQTFALPLIMTSGGPQGTTNFVMFNVYQSAFTMQQPGLASAVSTIFMLCVLAISLAQMWLLRTKWSY